METLLRRPPLAEIRTSQREGIVVPTLLAVQSRLEGSEGLPTEVTVLQEISNKHSADFLIYNALTATNPLDEVHRPDEVDGVWYMGSSDVFLARGGRREQRVLENTEVGVRQMTEERKPTVAICNGDQLVAVHLGGEVEDAGDQSESGVIEHRLIDGRTLTMLAVHNNRVLSLPEGAEVFGVTDKDPYSMWGIEDFLRSYENHPELRNPHVKYAEKVINAKIVTGDPNAYAKFENPDREITETENEALLAASIDQARAAKAAKTTA